MTTLTETMPWKVKIFSTTEVPNTITKPFPTKIPKSVHTPVQTLLRKTKVELSPPKTCNSLTSITKIDVTSRTCLYIKKSRLKCKIDTLVVTTPMFHMIGSAKQTILLSSRRTVIDASQRTFDLGAVTSVLWLMLVNAKIELPRKLCASCVSSSFLTKIGNTTVKQTHITISSSDIQPTFVRISAIAILLTTRTYGIKEFFIRSIP